MFAFGLIDVTQLIAIGSEDVGRGQDMRDVVMEAEVVIDDGMGDVIVPAIIIFSCAGLSCPFPSSSCSSSAQRIKFIHSLQQMFQRPSPFLRPLFHIMHLRLRNPDRRSTSSD